MIAPATNKRMEAAARSAALCPAAFCRMIPDFRAHDFRVPARTASVRSARTPFTRSDGKCRMTTFRPFGRQSQNDDIHKKENIL